MIQIVYMPCGPEPGNFDEQTRWTKYASTFDPDEQVNFSSDPITNNQYLIRASQIQSQLQIQHAPSQDPQ